MLLPAPLICARMASGWGGAKGTTTDTLRSVKGSQPSVGDAVLEVHSWLLMSSVDEGPRPFYMGVCFREQIRLSIPMDVHDVSLDGVIVAA